MAKTPREQGFGKKLREEMLRGELSAWLGWRAERLAVEDVLAGWKTALAARGRPGSPLTVQLYMHFAFCQSSCRFCQYFHVVPHEPDAAARYADHVVASIERYAGALGTVEVSNAYLGGGTPSALPAAELRRIAAAARGAFTVKSEFSSEAHPANLDEEKLEVLAQWGVNRLSMGVQSFDPAVLRRIGRTNPELRRVSELVQRARGLGMWTNLDLVLGLPGQSADSFRADLHCLLAVARPDCITMYRYQPVELLSDPPPPEMRYSRVLSRALERHAVRHGYLPATTGGDERPGKAFVRNSARTWRQWLERLGYEALRVVRADAEMPSYALYEDNDSHLIGIGPGALSHIYGCAWYREATAIRSLSSRSEPIFIGTRLNGEDECRATLLLRLARSRWIDVRALEQRSGVDVEAVFGPVLDAAVRAGALGRIGRRFYRSTAPPSAAHAALREALLPAQEGDAERALAIWKLRDDDAVQKELIAIDADQLAAAEPGASSRLAGAPAPPCEEALRSWMEAIGLGGVGQSFAGARIEWIAGREARFRILPPPAEALRVIVEDDHGQRAFSRAGRYAISYANHTDGSPLDSLEVDFLHSLCSHTIAVLGVGPAQGPHERAAGAGRGG